MVSSGPLNCAMSRIRRRRVAGHARPHPCLLFSGPFPSLPSFPLSLPPSVPFLSPCFSLLFPPSLFSPLVPSPSPLFLFFPLPCFPLPLPLLFPLFSLPFPFPSPFSSLLPFPPSLFLPSLFPPLPPFFPPSSSLLPLSLPPPPFLFLLPPPSPPPPSPLLPPPSPLPRSTVRRVPAGRGFGFNGAQLLGLAIGGCFCNDLHYVAAEMGVGLGKISISVRVDPGERPVVYQGCDDDGIMRDARRFRSSAGDRSWPRRDARSAIR